MRILQVFNRRKDWGGEDNSIDQTVDILNKKGMETLIWTRAVSEIRDGLIGKTGAFFSGIYSLKSARMLRYMLQGFMPDVVEFHNIYPQLSPSVLRECWQERIPVVWHPHDQRPICATGLSLYRGSTCERCTDGRDYWCILRNCRGNLFESSAYAIRNAVHRRFKFFQRYVHVTVVWSEFLRQRLLKEGFHHEHTLVVPHPVSVPEKAADPARGSYVAYLGRLSPEKGIRTLLEAAARVPDIPFHIAGDLKSMNGEINHVPANVKLVGWLERASIPEFLAKARLSVLPSVCFETFPTAALEAMSHGIPVVGSRIGGIPEAVLDGRTGLLFDPGDSEQLAERIQSLWHDPQLCAHLGAEGREMVARQYSADAYFASLIQAYELAIELARR